MYAKHTPFGSNLSCRGAMLDVLIMASTPWSIRVPNLKCLACSPSKDRTRVLQSKNGSRDSDHAPWDVSNPWASACYVISIDLCTKFEEYGFAVFFAAHLCLIQCSLPFPCVVVRLHCSFAVYVYLIRCRLLLNRAYYRLALTIVASS